MWAGGLTGGGWGGGWGGGGGVGWGGGGGGGGVGGGGGGGGWWWCVRWWRRVLLVCWWCAVMLVGLPGWQCRRPQPSPSTSVAPSLITALLQPTFTSTHITEVKGFPLLPPLSLPSCPAACCMRSSGTVPCWSLRRPRSVTW